MERVASRRHTSRFVDLCRRRLAYRQQAGCRGRHPDRDAAHRLQTATDSRGPKRLTYTYSPGGRRTSLQDSDGSRTDYTYDPVGRLTGIWAPTGDLVTFGYDPGGRLTEKWFPMG